MTGTPDPLEGFEARRPAAVARALSIAERGGEAAAQLLASLYPRIGHARRVGLTGPPGAGKSTLAERLTAEWRRHDLTVAIVAVDPTSPFSGGALLGDRIRMGGVALDPGVFIRSMATRGAVGGLAAATREACDVLDAAGYDRILVETVGVGQSELDVARAADTVLLVLVPEAGDGIQTLKSGIMEVADLFVVNKADRPGAERLVTEIEVALGMRQGQAFPHLPPRSGAAAVPDDRWQPQVLTTAALEGTGVAVLVDALDRHAGWLEGSGMLETRRADRREARAGDVLRRQLAEWAWQQADVGQVLQANSAGLRDGTLSPWQLATAVIERISLPPAGD